MKKSLYFHLKTSVQRFACRLWRDQKGAVAPLFLVSATVIFGASLGAIDLARYTAAASRLQTSLDSAALAAGRLATINPGADRLAEAQAYFDANFPPGYMGSNLGSSLTLTESGGADGGTLTLTLNGTLPLISTGFLDVSSMDLKGTSVVRMPGVSGVEVVFAIDKGNHNNHAKLGAAAEQLAQGLMLQDEGNAATSRPDVFVGVVPFSSVINVSGEANAKYWVERWWQGKFDPNSTNRQYTQNVWKGCIAEPTPWNPPHMPVEALSPESNFHPVFVRVMSLVTEKNDKNGTTQLPNKTGDEIEENYDRGDRITLDPTDDRYDRRLWADFTLDSPGQSNNEKFPAFRVFGAFEPKTCVTQLALRFLSSEYDSAVKPTLAIVANVVVSPLSDTALSGGLLWSWRMLHPDWRGGNGWFEPDGLAKGGKARRKVIVVFSGGRNASWSTLAAEPEDPTWSDDPGNQSAFSFEYEAETRRTHNQEAFIPLVKNNAKFWVEEVQRPATSLAMADPFEYEIKPDFTGWPTVPNYTKAICRAIKQSGDTPISIYVVDANANANGGSNSSAASELIDCSSETKAYTASNVDLATLRNRILQDGSTSSRLRLIR